MRIKNKEIRRRRHRKEIKIKDAARELRVQYGDKKDAAPAAKKPAAPKKDAPAAKKSTAPKAKKTEE